MGWRFRKSINCGLGFRINLSDSGIGWSWGAPGYRVTHKANGGVRKTYSFPGTGLSYIEENSVKNKNKQRTNSMERYNLENKSFTPVVNGKIDSISSPENKVFVDSLNSILKKNFITWLIGGILLLIIFILGGNLHMPSWANLLLFYGSLTLFFAICIPLTYTRYILLDYNIENNIKNIINKRNEAFEVLSNCSKIWYIENYSNVTYSRVQAGCQTLISKKLARLQKKKLPIYLRTTDNSEFFQLKIGATKYIFLPDKIVVIKSRTTAVLNYNDINVKLESRQFVENETIPDDAEFLYNTWLYVNNNGTPDRRFSNNRQLPVYHYKRIYLQSNSGLNVHLMVSSATKADKFKELFDKVPEIF